MFMKNASPRAMRNRISSLSRAVLALALVPAVLLGSAFLAGCDDESAAVSAIEQVNSDETWAIYWYLCGSDLESEYGAGSADIAEMTSADLSDNVKVVVQTGGASYWTTDVDADQTQRYLYTSKGLELVDEQPEANMGDASTLASFLEFCSESYPADHTAVILWNHGGGSVGGIAYDENYGYDSLSLTELESAFAQVYGESPSSKPIEIIGFDACLMASIDTASAISDYASYMVASEESEPGCGWNYTSFLQGLSRNTGMGAQALGKLICDTYVEGCASQQSADEATLSVVDLDKVPELLEAYNSVGAEALSYVSQNSSFYAQYSRCAETAENYGGNTASSGYTDMVDIGDLMRGSSDILPETSANLISMLEDCVVYKVNGAYRQNASGLSCYHAYDGVQSYEAYCEVSSSEAFEDFYGYSLTGSTSDYASSQLGIQLPTYEEGESLPSQGDSQTLDEHEVYVDDDGYANLDIGYEAASSLTNVLVHFAYYDEEYDYVVDLGDDTDVYADWDTGVFTDNFQGYWCSIDGSLCYREVVYAGDDYTLYAVPILLNGEECTLSVAYDYGTGEYEILGARPANDVGYMTDKYLITLKEGDEVIPLHYGLIGDDDEFTLLEAESITVTSETSFYDIELGDGTYLMYFDMRDGQNESYYSANVYFTVEGETIYTEV